MAIGTLMSSVQRHEAYWVSKPPRTRPMAAPPPATAPYTPNARARSFGSVNVTVSKRQGGRGHYGRERALQGPGPEEHRPVLRQPTQSGGGGEAEEADDEHPLAAHEVGYPPADQQQAAERQRVRRQGPLAVGERDVQGTLGRGEGDSHH